MARIKDQSVRDVVAAANIVEVVCLRTSLRKSSGTRYMGRCPFHEERSPSFSVNADLNLYHCFGCGKGGDVVTFVRETEGLDFVGAIEWLAERFRVTARVRGELAAGGRGAPPARAPLRRCSTRRRRSSSATSGRGRTGSPCAPISRAAGSARRSRRSSGSASHRDTASPRRRGRRASPQTSCVPQGSTNQRGNDYFPPRLMFPLADARGRVIGFQARKLHDDDPLQGQVRQLARERAVQEEQRPLRAPPRPAGDREAGPGGRRRGQHRRDRAAPGGIRAGRRLDGHRADRARTCASSRG